MSDCERARGQLLAAMREQLTGPDSEAFARHLQTCSECSRIFERERQLDRALERRPVFALPDRLRDALSARLGEAKAKPKPRVRRLLAFALPTLAAGMLALFLVHGFRASGRQLVEEAVNDHLRVLYAVHPIEIESGGIHQVKPWFSGRLDFAPPLSFSGDDEFPMLGGAVGLFVDRKAATFVFKHRLHTATLFVFRSEGLGWPVYSAASVGALPALSAASRGFNVLLWRDGDLGYALVSDADPSALARLGAKVVTR